MLILNGASTSYPILPKVQGLLWKRGVQIAKAKGRRYLQVNCFPDIAAAYMTSEVVAVYTRPGQAQARQTWRGKRV